MLNVTNYYESAYFRILLKICVPGYSSCDVFAAEMQDNKVATIFGEDGYTGSGGASVIDHTYLAENVPNQFQFLPYELDGMFSISVGLSLGMRPSGQIIEDYGVQSDQIIRPSVSDIMYPDGRTSQLDKIARALHNQLRVKDRTCNIFLLVLVTLFTNVLKSSLHWRKRGLQNNFNYLQHDFHYSKSSQNRCLQCSE